MARPMPRPMQNPAGHRFFQAFYRWQSGKAVQHCQHRIRPDSTGTRTIPLRPNGLRKSQRQQQRFYAGTDADNFSFSKSRSAKGRVSEDIPKSELPNAIRLVRAEKRVRPCRVSRRWLHAEQIFYLWKDNFRAFLRMSKFTRCTNSWVDTEVSMDGQIELIISGEDHRRKLHLEYLDYLMELHAKDGPPPLPRRRGTWAPDEGLQLDEDPVKDSRRSAAVRTYVIEFPAHRDPHYLSSQYLHMLGYQHNNQTLIVVHHQPGSETKTLVLTGTDSDIKASLKTITRKLAPDVPAEQDEQVNEPDVLSTHPIEMAIEDADSESQSHNNSTLQQATLPSPDSSPLDLVEDFKAMMRCMPSPVCLITASVPSLREDGKLLLSDHRGLLVSSLTTVTLTPKPIVSINIKLPSRTYDAIQQSGSFSLHVLAGVGEGARVADLFTKPYDEPSQPFYDLVNSNTNYTHDDVHGLKLNGRGVLSSCIFDVVSDKSIEVGDHIILIATCRGPTRTSPLLYAGPMALAYAQRSYRTIDEEPVEIPDAATLSTLEIHRRAEDQMMAFEAFEDKIAGRTNAAKQRFFHKLDREAAVRNRSASSTTDKIDEKEVHGGHPAFSAKAGFQTLQPRKVGSGSGIRKMLGTRRKFSTSGFQYRQQDDNEHDEASEVERRHVFQQQQQQQQTPKSNQPPRAHPPGKDPLKTSVADFLYSSGQPVQDNFNLRRTIKELHEAGPERIRQVIAARDAKVPSADLGSEDRRLSSLLWSLRRAIAQGHIKEDVIKMLMQSSTQQSPPSS